MTTPSTALCLALLLPAAPLATEPSSEEVTAAELEEHLSYLASDELGGRRVGTPELNEAGRYLARQLEAYGLEPAGDGESFLQEMWFETESYTALPELALGAGEGDGRGLTYGSDFRLRSGGPAGSFAVRVLDAETSLPDPPDPELALVLSGMNRGRALRWLKEQGCEHGAGFGLVVTAMRREYDPSTKLPRGGRPRLVEGETPSGSQPAGWVEVSPAVFAALVESPPERLRFDSHFERLRLPSYNVLGRLPAKTEGAEAIVVSAHYDHIGTLPPGDDPEADRIRNGADDDASGVAVVLEIAEAMAAGGPREREVLFLLATAEEIGIVGTRYYLDHPTTPLERTVCNLNFEMLGRPDPEAGGPGKLWLTGAERTNLMEAYRAAGFDLVADPHPEQNFFERSDNIVFCWEGIVGQTFSTYNLHEDYHQVTDEVDRIDFEHMQACARSGLQAVELVADGEVNPEWLEGGRPKARRR